MFDKRKRAKAVDKRRIPSRFLADVNVTSLALRASLRNSTYFAKMSIEIMDAFYRSDKKLLNFYPEFFSTYLILLLI